MSNLWEVFLNHSMNPSYFKSTIGILKIFSLLLCAVVVGLATYSHFQSHWTYHSGLFRDRSFLVSELSFQNDYEDCIHNKRFYSDAHGGLHDSDSHSVTCPKPEMEIILVSVSISVLLLTILSILLCCFSKCSKLRESLRFFDLLFHGVSCFSFLIGSILFIYSAFQISNWCSAKAKSVIPRKYYLVEDFPVNIENVDVALDTNAAQARDDTIYPELEGPQQRSGMSLDNGKAHLIGNSELPEEASQYFEDVCNLVELTEDKYWAAGLGLVASVLYGAILVLIISTSDATNTAATQAVHPAEVTVIRASRGSGAGRVSFDKGVGTDSSRIVRDDTYNDNY